MNDIYTQSWSKEIVWKRNLVSKKIRLLIAKALKNEKGNLISKQQNWNYLSIDYIRLKVWGVWGMKKNNEKVLHEHGFSKLKASPWITWSFLWIMHCPTDGHIKGWKLGLKGCVLAFS